jgi:hypothetical protein
MTKEISLEAVPNIHWLAKEIEAYRQPITFEKAGTDGDFFYLRLRSPTKYLNLRLPYEWLEDLGGEHCENCVARLRSIMRQVVNRLR